MRTRLNNIKGIRLLIMVLIVMSFFQVSLIYGEPAISQIWINDPLKVTCHEGEYVIVDGELHLEGEYSTTVYHENSGSNVQYILDTRYVFDDSEDAWVGYKLRCDNPDKQIWDCESGYFFIIRKNQVEVGKVTQEDGVQILMTTPLDIVDGQYYHVEITIVNDDITGDPKLTFTVDDNSILTYIDTESNEKLQFGQSAFSINTFKYAETFVDMGVDETSVQLANREINTSNYKGISHNAWFINTPMVANDLPYYDVTYRCDGDMTELSGIGSLTYKNSLKTNGISFNMQIVDGMEETASYTIFWFLKSNRADYVGHGNYGVMFYDNGVIGLVESRDNQLIKYPAVKTDYQFDTSKHIIIQWEVVNEVTQVYIYIESDILAYVFTINEPLMYEKERNFVGIYNEDIYNIVRISHMMIEGEEQVYSDERQPDQIYLIDHFVDEEGEFIHFEYKDQGVGYHLVKAYNTSNNFLGVVSYPNNIIRLEESVTSDIHLVVESIDNVKTEQVLPYISDKMIDLRRADIIQLERIGIRSNDETGAEFYGTTTKEPFYMNGVNLVKLRFGDHSTFEPASMYLPADYDPYYIESVLNQLHENQMNTVRVFIASGRTAYLPGVGGPSGYTEPLYSGYMDNLVDFLERCNHYGIYVIVNFCENELPNNDYFNNRYNLFNQQEILFSRPGLEGKLEYTKLFLEYIDVAEPKLLSNILAVQAQNEFVFLTDQEPFNQVDGKYMFFGNHTIYDMSDNQQRRSLANMAMQYYYANLKDAIHSVDPQILLCEGTCTYSYSGEESLLNVGLLPTVPYTPMNGIEYLETAIDFLDIHCYQVDYDDVDGYLFFLEQLDSMGLMTDEALLLRQEKPVIIGEYGANKRITPDFQEAIMFINEQQDQSVLSGMKGSLLWSYDLYAQDDWYNLEELGPEMMNQLQEVPNSQFVIKVPKEKKRLSVIYGIVILAVLLVIFILVYGRRRMKTKRKIMLENKDKSQYEEINHNENLQQSNGVPHKNESFHRLKKQLESMKECSLVINMFGEMVVYHNGEAIDSEIMNSTKANQLFAYLIISEDPVDKDRIINNIWGDQESKKMADLFHSTVYKLRKCLKKIDPNNEYVICANRKYYVDKRLFVCAHWLYNEDLEFLLEEESNDKTYLKEKAELFEAIIDSYKEDFLYSYDLEWIDIHRHYYQRSYEGVLKYLAKYYYETFEDVKAIKYLEALIYQDPYRSTPYLTLMQLHHRNGENKKVYDVYDQLRILLENELGIALPDEINTFIQEIQF